MKQHRKFLKRLLLVCAAVLFLYIPSVTCEAAKMTDSPYVTISAGGTRFMIGNGIALPYTDLYTNYIRSGTSPEYWYPVGTERSTGIQSELRELKTGEHYYVINRSGEIPVGKWVVAWSKGRCIHDHEVEREEYSGETGLSLSPCFSAYPSGWYAYCADCGQKIMAPFVYATKDMINTIDSLNMDYGYMYLCPTDRHLETAGYPTPHQCKAPGWNRYKVIYDSNFPENSLHQRGYMDPSFHMYNNETEYEGETVTPNTHLTLNDYSCEGYAFAGWATTPEGAVTYTDGQEIYNLTEYDYKDEEGRGIITLYAVWETSDSTLHIDPNGGSYEGSAAVTSITQKYETVYDIDMDRLVAPKSATVSFETNGGNAIAPIACDAAFDSWVQSSPFNGIFVVSRNRYGFVGEDGSEDTLTATYKATSIILPTPTKPGENFAGWYEDPECEQEYVGTGGEEYTPTEDVTLYANWAKLVLESEENYTANGKKGAADLTWQQKDSADKVYKLYLSSDGTTFQQVYSAEDGTTRRNSDKSDFSAGGTQTYTVPYSGIYTLTVRGAAGASYGSFQGGKGGMVSARFFLSKGEILTVKTGAMTGAGYAAGGTGSKFANGGGATGISSNKKGLLLLAGGGGGATSLENGGAGGLATSVTTGSAGGRGGAGGGGGYKGGNGGVVSYHYHTDSAGNRTNDTANSQLLDASGGCYRRPTGVQVPCGTFRSVHTGTFCDTCYEQQVGSPYGWVGSGSHSPGGYNAGHRYRYVYSVTCSGCGVGGSPAGGTHYRSGTKYALTCGYAEGEITASTKAYGGSSYVSGYALSQSQTAGENAGNGKTSISAYAVGYTEGTRLNGVPAPDLAAPDKIDINTLSQESAGDGSVFLSFETPQDHGTQYWFKCESYPPGSESVMCVSNITTNTLTTGVAGYYYLVDTTPRRVVTKDNAANKNNLLTGNRVKVNLGTATEVYLHIAACDVAGNVGETLDVLVRADEIAWDVVTGQAKASGVVGGRDYGTVYNDGTNIYVRADGDGPVSLSYASYLKGKARSDYQIDCQNFEVAVTDGSKTQQFTTTLPYSQLSASSITVSPAGFRRASTGDRIFLDASNTGAKRTNYAKENSFYQVFKVSRAVSGKTIRVTPIAGATDGLNNRVVMSDYTLDLTHSAYLIADGEGPVIAGTTPLDTLDSQTDVTTLGTTTINATDDLSGLKDLKVTVVNEDSGEQEVFQPDADGNILIDFENNVIFNGSVKITVEATDNVGNVTRQEYDLTAFRLEAEITNARDVTSNVFRRGEAAVLVMDTFGYAEKVEFILPPELLTGNEGIQNSFVYTSPDFLEEEVVLFQIPYYGIDNGTYTVTVRAYKNGQVLYAYPQLEIVDGSILNDVRVRIR